LVSIFGDTWKNAWKKWF
jgi:hypothetical protein